MKKNLLPLLSIFFLAAFFSSCINNYDSDFDFDDIKSQCNSSVNLFNDDPYIVLMPENPIAGMVFLPGGLVSYQSYLPLMVKCANKGIACFIIRMPGDFAILNTNAATRVLRRYKEIENWYISGHSLGGAMAAGYVANTKENFKGLILLAAYSTEKISDENFKVLSVYGSNDKVLNMEKYEKYKANLPSNFTELVIQGGNHGQFGNYGNQKGDGDATVSREEQQDKTAEAIFSLITN